MVIPTTFTPFRMFWDTVNHISMDRVQIALPDKLAYQPRNHKWLILDPGDEVGKYENFPLHETKQPRTSLGYRVEEKLDHFQAQNLYYNLKNYIILCFHSKMVIIWLVKWMDTQKMDSKIIDTIMTYGRKRGVIGLLHAPSKNK